MMHKTQIPDNNSNGHTFSKRQIVQMLAICVLILLLVFTIVIPETAYRSARALALKGDCAAAFEKFDELGNYRDSWLLRGEAGAELATRALALRDFASVGKNYESIGDRSSEAAGDVRNSVKATAESMLLSGLYQTAFDCFSSLPDDDYYNSARDLERCRAAAYDALVVKYERTSVVPYGFDVGLLADYRDSGKYIVMAQLQASAWDPKNSEKEINLLYSLGDFRNVRETGFLVLRLHGHRFSNSNGYYFGTDDRDDWVYNLPAYRFSGYYGLYSKFIGNVFYIGSDEKQSWTWQFTFLLDDLDNTLHVTCARTGQTITLQKEY
ncbi:MAG: hypothetical protein RR998_08880 [Oscillospiraceae bacterium]